MRKPDEHVAVSGPVMFAVLGTTVMGDCCAFVLLTTLKFAICALPDVTSVARICAGCVVAFASACTETWATPALSVTTEMVWACGALGLLVLKAIGPYTTSKRISRPTSGAPPGPSAATRAVPVCAEHRSDPQSLPVGVKVRLFRSGAGITLTGTSI